MENFFLIVGLGNPGRQYESTRHNAGFMVVEKLGKRWGAQWSQEKKFEARVSRVGKSFGQVLLAQPQTFMNLSGKSVAAIAGFYKIDAERILAVVDDADLSLGQLRLRTSGSSGGHHGLESIEQHLGTNKFARQRLGILGRVDSGPREISGSVLGTFSKAEAELLQLVLEKAADQADCWLTEGPEKAMTKFNGAIQRPEETNK